MWYVRGVIVKKVKIEFFKYWTQIDFSCVEQVKHPISSICYVYMYIVATIVLVQKYSDNNTNLPSL